MYTALEIKNKLLTDDRWLFRGVLALYALQTAEERSEQDTFVDNGRGFNSVDGKALSELADALLNNGRITKIQVAEARRRMIKYATQLAAIANNKGA